MLPWQLVSPISRAPRFYSISSDSVSNISFLPWPGNPPYLHAPAPVDSPAVDLCLYRAAWPFSHEIVLSASTTTTREIRRFELVRRRLLSESIFTHFTVALGVLLLTSAIIISPQGNTLAAAAPRPVVTITSVQSGATAMQHNASGTSFARASPVETFRGSRESSPAATPAPTAPVAPASIPTTGPASNPPSTHFRVGIQAGHWKESELPAELASLRGETGAVGTGWREVDVNLSVANSVAALLRRKGIQVDVLPATVPVGYSADAFLAIHGDANDNTSFSGFKMARATWSKIPRRDDALVAAVSATYQAATGLPEDTSTITENMRQYYAFNWMGLKHAVAPTTPSAIIELGFLTTASDRDLILGHEDRVASGIADGIMRFLTGK